MCFILNVNLTESIYYRNEIKQLYFTSRTPVLSTFSGAQKMHGHIDKVKGAT